MEDELTEPDTLHSALIGTASCLMAKRAERLGVGYRSHDRHQIATAS